MSAINRFEIHLEHDIDEQYQYEPGETLLGSVLLTLDSEVALKAITIQIKGEATVSWDEDAYDRSAAETYVDHVYDLVAAPDTGEVMKLAVGKHEYPLEFELPDILPSSFIGKFGSITYVIKATLREDKRFGLSSTITSEPFLVLRSLDIYQEQKLMMKRTESREARYYGTFCCISGKLTMGVTLNKTGHLPGEDMFIDAEIVNGSPRTVKAIQASLIMHSAFHAKHKSRRNIQVVNKKRDDYEIPYGDGRRWNKVRLTIPPYIPESRLDGCDIIDISYELEFKAEIAKGNELHLAIPITVGTVDSSLDTKVRPRRFLKQGETLDNMEMLNGNADNEADDGQFVDIDMDEEEHAKFRRPMNPGETRKNPLFNN